MIITLYVIIIGYRTDTKNSVWRDGLAEISKLINI